MLLITQSLNLLEPIGPAPTPPTAASVGVSDGGGIFVVPRKKIEQPLPEYKPKLAPIPLRAQYDMLLEAGVLTEDEWIGVLMMHGINPVPLVPA